jgi:hypothetical protein
LNPPHHPRVIRRPTLAIGAIRPVEPAEIHLLDRPKHRPHEVLLGQPVNQRRGHQQHLLTIRSNEVLTHPRILLNRPDGTP